MEIKKMVEASLLCALFIVCSIFAISTGLLYGVYIDIIVPIFIAIIFLRCDFKFSVLSIITCLLIVGLIMGNIGSAICMSQSMIIGILCGILINKNTKFFDDLFYLSIISGFIMIMIDISFSTLIGFSFIKDCKDIINSINVNFIFKEIGYYILVASLPLGTVIMTYFASLFLGDRLNSLGEFGKRKFYILKNFRKLSNYIFCSQYTIYFGLIYIFLMQIKNILGINLKYIYLITITETIKYIIYYFLIRDAYAYLRIFIYNKTKSMLLVNLVGIMTLLALVLKFKASFWIVSIFSFFYIPKKLNKLN